VTTRIGLLQKIHEWVAAMTRKPDATVPERPAEEPLHRLERLLVGIVCTRGLRMETAQVMVDALSLDTITCKTRAVLREGDQLELSLLLQGVGSVTLHVEVDWVLLSSYGHTLGLKVLHDEGSRELLNSYLQVKNNSRG
jgi:hypothetical protein